MNAKAKSKKKSTSTKTFEFKDNIGIKCHSGICSNCRSQEKFKKKKGVGVERVIRAEGVICYRLPVTAKLLINGINVLYEDEYSGNQQFSTGRHLDLCLNCIREKSGEMGESCC